MKFYNPFKPHIVELSDGWFAVRRFTSTGGQYLECRIPYDYWWSSLAFKNHFEVPTLERAQELLSIANDRNKPPPKIEVVKVHL